MLVATALPSPNGERLLDRGGDHAEDDPASPSPHQTLDRGTSRATGERSVIHPFERDERGLGWHDVWPLQHASSLWLQMISGILLATLPVSILVSAWLRGDLRTSVPVFPFLVLVVVILWSGAGLLLPRTWTRARTVPVQVRVRRREIQIRPFLSGGVRRIPAGAVLRIHGVRPVPGGEPEAPVRVVWLDGSHSRSFRITGAQGRMLVHLWSSQDPPWQVEPEDPHDDGPTFQVFRASSPGAPRSDPLASLGERDSSD